MSFPVILPEPFHEARNPVAEIGLRAIDDQPLQKAGIRPSSGDVAHLHRHVVADRLLPEAILNRIDEIEQADVVGIADVDVAERDQVRQAVTLRHHSIDGAFGHSIDQQPNGADQIVDIRKV